LTGRRHVGDDRGVRQDHSRLCRTCRPAHLWRAFVFLVLGFSYRSARTRRPDLHSGLSTERSQHGINQPERSVTRDVPRIVPRDRMGRAMLTLAGAAERAGTSKSTVHRWIRSGRLSASRADDGSTYLIDPSELERVLSASRPAERPVDRPMGQDGSLTSVPRDEDLRVRNAELAAELKAMHTLLVAAERREADLRAERDKWAEQAQRLALAPPAAPRVMLWRRMFG
jgi:excisionase family DNA binding protein